MSSMSEKGVTVTGLKHEKRVVRFKHLKVTCVLLDAFSLLYFVGAMFVALSLYRRYHIWWPALLLSSLAIFNFWDFRRIKHAYIQHTLASADSDLLRTTLPASSSKKVQ